MYYEEEINIVGIIPESEVTGYTTVKEIEKVIYDGLMLGPIFEPLAEVLKEEKKIDSAGEIDLQDVVSTLYSNSFLQNCPKFVSKRETYANLKLISAALVILKRNYLPIDLIRQGLNAYVLVCRENKEEDYLQLVDGKVHRALRLVNKSISDTVYKYWFDYVKTNLEWNKKEKRDFEREHKVKRNYDIPFIMPHEFLFLLCNSLNRLETISRLHKPDLSSQLDNVYQWEISEGKSMKQMQELGHVMHIHLLRKDAFVNKAPHLLLAKALNQETENKRITYVGIKPPKDNRTIQEVNLAIQREASLAAARHDATPAQPFQQALTKKGTKRDLFANSQSKFTRGASKETKLTLEERRTTLSKYVGGVTPVEKDTYQRELQKIRHDIEAKEKDLKNTKANAQHIMETYHAMLKYGHHYEKIDDSDDGEAKLDRKISSQAAQQIRKLMLQKQSSKKKRKTSKPQTANSKPHEFLLDSPKEEKKETSIFIRPETALPTKKTKKLSNAVMHEARSSRPMSSFIDQNKKLFMDVSRLNLKRAEQIRKQFTQKREFVFNQLKSNQKSINDLKSQSMMVQPKGAKTPGEASRPSSKYFQIKKNSERPASSYGGVQAPQRHIKNIVSSEQEKIAILEQEQLRNKLENMTVLKSDGESFHTRGDETKAETNAGRLGATAEYTESGSLIINKGAILQNWIQEELTKFEEKMDKEQKETHIKIRDDEDEPVPNLLSSMHSASKSHQFLFKRPQNLALPEDGTMSASAAHVGRTFTSGFLHQKQLSHRSLKGSPKDMTQTLGSHRNVDASTAQSVGTTPNRANVAHSYNFQSQAAGHVSRQQQQRANLNHRYFQNLNSLPSSQARLMPEEYKRLMLVKDPTMNKSGAISQYRNAATVSVKQAVALQQGLSASRPKEGVIDPSNFVYGLEGAQSLQVSKNIVRYTKDKRPVSSHTMLRSIRAPGAQKNRVLKSAGKVQASEISGTTIGELGRLHPSISTLVKPSMGVAQQSMNPGGTRLGLANSLQVLQ